LGGREDTAEKIRTAIEIAGVEFIDEEEGATEGATIRLKERSMSIGRFAGRWVELGPARRADWPASGG